MSNWHSLLPTPYKWRELWDMSGVNGLTVPSAIFGGHALTITGGLRQTSASGVHFDGTATSNINCGAIHNSATKLWVSFRFRLDQDFGVGSSSMHLFAKRIDADNWLDIALDGTDGEIKWRLRTGSVDRFDVSGLDGAGALITSWTAGTWYHVLASISSVNAVRFRINNGIVATDADTTALMAGGDFVIGDEDDPGLGAGFVGTISTFAVGTDDLDTDEEDNLAVENSLPGDAVNVWLLDEGRGTTVTDRGSGANNGTLDTSAAWSFLDGAYPVLSFDSISDKAETAAAIDISGDLTLVWVGKSRISPWPEACIFLKIDNDNNIWIGAPLNAFTYTLEVAASTIYDTAADDETLGQPLIIVASKSSSASVCYINGATSISLAGVEGPSGLATCYLGWVSYGLSGTTGWDMSAPSLVGVINGALSQTEAVRLTQKLNAIYNLGITI